MLIPEVGYWYQVNMLLVSGEFAVRIGSMLLVSGVRCWHVVGTLFYYQGYIVSIRNTLLLP